MHLRSRARRRLREAIASGWERLPDDPAGQAPTGLVSPEVLRAMSALSARQRAVVFLTYWEDLDERQTADRLGVSVGTVRQHLHRARRQIGRNLR